MITERQIAELRKQVAAMDVAGGRKIRAEGGPFDGLSIPVSDDSDSTHTVRWTLHTSRGPVSVEYVIAPGGRLVYAGDQKD